MTLSPLAIGIGAALGGATAYGINIVYARMSTQMGVSAGDLVFLRVFLMLGGAALAARLTGGSLRIERPAWPALILVGVTSAGLGLAYFFAVSFVPIGVAAVIVYTFPLIILIASPFVDGTKLTPSRLFVFTLAFIGIAIALGPTFGAYDPRGLILAALASLLAASQFFAASRAGARMPAGALLFWSHIVIMPIAGFVALMVGTSPVSAFATAWFACVMTIAGYLAGFALQMYAARKAPTALVGLVFCLEPVVAIISAGLILGETLTASQIMGSLLVLTALIASSFVELRRSASPT
ncbi:DMT family transporter [Phreatobacter aquaticus]|uniref:DMT family transporter n=1 Tax=Phreatobacter aquaticus TaxID=2570229 RepID=A0A4D7QLT4_9HYPH|nr:DMT family transporter [Phreatobacter aquaticus]QCK85212.1 DMT family transporter [Phreatobacter aquaticus]